MGATIHILLTGGAGGAGLEGFILGTPGGVLLELAEEPVVDAPELELVLGRDFFLRAKV